MNTLTKKQKKFHDVWLQHIQDHGHAPTYIQMQNLMGFSSPNSVYQNLNRLRRKGWMHGDVPTALLECCPHCGKPITLKPQKNGPDPF